MAQLIPNLNTCLPRMTVGEKRLKNGVREYLETLMSNSRCFLAQRTLSGFTVKSLYELYSALLRAHSGRIMGTSSFGSRQRASLVLVTLFLILEYIVL